MPKQITIFNNAEGTLRLLASILTYEGYEVFPERFGTKEVQGIATAKPALIMLDCTPRLLFKGWYII
jgi:hypothetical protein